MALPTDKTALSCFEITRILSVTVVKDQPAAFVGKHFFQNNMFTLGMQYQLQNRLKI